MLIEKTHNDTFTAFQRMPGSSVKAGFICEAKNRGDAVRGVIEMVARHCTVMGISPARILTGVECK